ncbi:MAG: hypothetical protein NC080_06650 [Paraprevotella sp.]|nr:hypothetical protein [Paraprevotella sp.]
MMEQCEWPTRGLHIHSGPQHRKHIPFETPIVTSRRRTGRQYGYCTSTMLVANAQIRAGKDFEPVVVPKVGHTMGEAFWKRKRFGFFVSHLTDKTSLKWDEAKRQTEEHHQATVILPVGYS